MNYSIGTLRPQQSPSIFFFNDTATTEIYTLSLHDALPICKSLTRRVKNERVASNHEASEEPTKLTKPQSGGCHPGDVRGSRTPPEARGASGHAGRGPPGAAG